jgi:hypothetical protein
MEKLGATASLTSGYRPQSNRQVKRTNQELGRFLRSHCQDQQGEWARFLPWAEYAQNSLRHSSTVLTPFQCVLRYQPALALWTLSQTKAPAVVRVVPMCRESVERCTREAQADHHRSEAPAFHPCDRIWLSSLLTEAGIRM